MKPTRNERVVPPVFKHVINSEFKLRLTWRERLKVAAGYAVTLNYIAYCSHSPGKIEQKMKPTITPH